MIDVESLVAVRPGDDTVTTRVTVPEKPFELGGKLVTFNVEVADEPDAKVSDDGVAEIVNFVTWIVIVT